MLFVVRVTLDVDLTADSRERLEGMLDNARFDVNISPDSDYIKVDDHMVRDYEIVREEE